MKGSEVRQDYPQILQKSIFVAVMFAGILAIAISLGSCSQGVYSKKTETITIAAPPLEQDALVYIADDRGFFAKNNLKIVFKDSDSGVTAINRMLKREADIAETAEFPFVKAIFQKEQVSIIASNDKFENDYIVGRKDRGIKSIADLKGKKIGLARGTIAEFYLGRVLELSGIKMQDVTLVDLKPVQFVGAIAGNGVDAIVAWQPFVHEIQEKEVNGVVVWPVQGSQAVYGVLVSRNGWIKQHTDTVKRFLKSLTEAEDYLVHHPGKAKTIVQKRLKYDDSYIASVWPQHKISLSLDFSLIAAMNDEAHWMIHNNLTTETAIPDFSNYVYVDGLKEIKPEAVNIIR